MKKNKIIYWSSTGIIALMMLFSGYSYLTSDAIKTAFTHVGFPSYFRIELAGAKILGAIALVLPMIPKKIKGFTYAGFVIVFISAFIAHMSIGDPISMVLMPLIFLGILAVSYIFANKIRN